MPTHPDEKLKRLNPESDRPEPAVSRIVRSRRKTLALFVGHDGALIVRAPNRLPRRVIDQFIADHQEWIIEKQARARATFRRLPDEYVEGVSFPYLGQWYPLEIVPDQGQALSLDGRFMLVESARRAGAQAFETWYRRQARQILTDRVRLFAGNHGFQFKTMRITGARSRWGACSSRGGLSFSWRLILTPMEVVDYVVVHELVHTRLHNHSKEFWQHVEDILPDYRERRGWLKTWGPGLMA
ncbi:MAG: M48 family metallopeptidase [Bacteroidota bacterium]